MDPKVRCRIEGHSAPEGDAQDRTPVPADCAAPLRGATEDMEGVAWWSTLMHNTEHGRRMQRHMACSATWHAFDLLHTYNAL